MLQTKTQTKSASPTTISLNIIAAAIVLTSLYFARTLVVTLICGIFIACVLEPGVRALERFRVARWVGSLVMMLATLALMYLIIYLIYTRVLVFTEHLPEITERL